MSGSLNSVTLIGRLARDPESRVMSSGGKVVNMTVVTSERWKDRAGNKQEKAEFHRCVVFNEKIADVAEKYLRKGSNIYLEGSLQTRKWTDSNGQERYSTEVVLQKFRGELVMLDGKGESQSNSQQGDYSQQSNDMDDEIPF